MTAGADTGAASGPGDAGTTTIVVREPKASPPRAPRWTRTAYKALVGWVAVGAAALFRFLGPAIALRVGRTLGLLGWHLRAADRRVALENLALAFPGKSEAERRRIARESFARVGMCALEWIAASRRDAYIDAVRLDGREHLDAARAKGKGLIWVTGHVGNWELMAAAVARAGYPCWVIATTVRYPRVNRLTIEERGRNKVGTVQRDSPTAGRELLKVFRRNDLIGILMDHDTKVPSVQVDFFGKPAWTAVGPAELSVRMGAPAVSGFFVRDPDGTRRVVIAPPLFPPEKVDKADALRVARDLTQQYTTRIEAHLRTHPEDWAWMHRRWKP